MNLTTLILSVSLSATPAVTSERPVWAGAIQPGGDVVVVAAVTGGLGVRTATASTLVAGDAAAPLGAGLCPGTNPRLAIPAGRTVFLLGPGSPATLIATVSLSSQAISAAVPVTTSAGCQLAVALQNGDVALVGASGGLTTLSQVLPATADWHEYPRGVLIAAQADLLVVGGVDGSLAAVQVSDGRRFTGSIPAAAVPGAVWSDGQPWLWFLGKTGSLHGWKVTTDAPGLARAATIAAPGGLVAWGGRADHGIAWADMQGQVFAWKNGSVRSLIRLPAAVRWPMLVADLDDTGDLKLVAPVDGQVAALVDEGDGGASFQLVPLAARPAGSPIAYQLTPDSPPVLAIPTGPTSGTELAADAVPAGQLTHDLAVLVPGTQVHGLVPGPMQAALGPPPVASGSLGGGSGGTGGSTQQAAPAKSGFGCSTVPAADALGLLVGPLLLLRRRRRTGV
ncbi:MAG: hypothetical protein WCS72_08450 [Deltaproteobacteria bacterium]